jgi:hypothetical protein
VDGQKKLGRPTTYTEELAKEICDSIASNGVSVAELCRRNNHWPHKVTIFRWIGSNPSFCYLYTQAKKCQVEVIADDLLEISDTCTEDNFHIARLQVDTRKWIACKLVPKVYGDAKQEDISQQNNEVDSIRDLVNKCNQPTQQSK